VQASYRGRPMAAHAQKISWSSLPKLALMLACLASSYYFAFRIAPSALGPASPTVQLGLYPEWIGCREILLSRQSPYRLEFNRSIQIAVYGSAAAAKQVNQQRFAYPAYFVFLFLPLALLPFPLAHLAALLGAILLTMLSLRLWGLCWNLSNVALVVVALTTFSTYPVVLGLQLCQPTLLIAGLLAVVVYWARSERLLWAGILAGFCMSKPHVAIGILLPLSVWTLAGWRDRRRFLIAFGCSTVALLAASELLLPGWVGPWLATVRAYSHYAGSKPLLMEVLHGHFVVPAITTLLCAVIAVSYRWRESDFLFAMSFSIAAFQLLFPFLIYNQIMLLPAALWLLKNASRINAADQLCGLLSSCSWIVMATGFASSIALCVGNLVVHGSALKLWELPLLAAWIYPCSVFLALSAWAVSQYPLERD
jgi:hypothetical protein